MLVDEYLSTSFRPDSDYVDGEVLERNWGGRRHSWTQRKTILYLGQCQPGLIERVFPELRVQVSATRFRIPDVCILAADAPEEEVARTAPRLCVEILSAEDSMIRVMERIEDYFAMGVPVCWVIDPRLKLGWIATPGHLDRAVDGLLRAEGIEMPLSEVLPA